MVHESGPKYGTCQSLPKSKPLECQTHDMDRPKVHHYVDLPEPAEIEATAQCACSRAKTTAWISQKCTTTWNCRVPTCQSPPKSKPCRNRSPRPLRGYAKNAPLSGIAPVSPNRPCAREPAEIETLQDHSVEVPEMHHKVECHIARVPIRNLPKENRSRANNAFGPRHPPPDPADDTRPEPAHIARRAVVPQGKGQRRLSGL